MKSKLIVDYGKPYEIEINSKKELRKELDKLKEISETEDFPYFDIVILDSNGNDITETEFIQKIMDSGRE